MLGLKTRKDIKRLFNQNISHKQWKHDCVLGHSMSTNILKISLKSWAIYIYLVRSTLAYGDQNMYNRSMSFKVLFGKLTLI